MKRVILIFSHNTLARHWNNLQGAFWDEGVELIALSQNAEIDWERFFDEKLSSASVVYFEGTHHFPYYQRLKAMAEANTWYYLVGGMDAVAEFPDGREKEAARFRAYLALGERSALSTSIRYLLYLCGLRVSCPPEPQEAVLCAVASGISMQRFNSVEAFLRSEGEPGRLPLVPLLYGRRYWTSDDMGIIAELQRMVAHAGFQAVPIFCDFSITNKLNEPEHPVAQLLDPVKDRVMALLNLAVSSVADAEAPDGYFRSLNRPVVQMVRDYGRTHDEWLESGGPLMGMAYSFSVVQPESLGVIEPTLIACNACSREEEQNGATPRALGVQERLESLGKRLARWQRLQALPNAEKRICIMLNNSPCKSVEATLGSAAGLESLESTVEVMRRLKAEGYRVDNIPEDGKALLNEIRTRKAHSEFRWTNVESIVANGGVLDRIGEAEYRRHFDLMDEDLRDSVDQAWGAFPAKSMVHPNDEGEPELLVTGLAFGNVTVMVEPKRGCWGPRCDGEVCRILHQPDIAPTHHWLATAWWVQERFDAMIHMGAESSMDFLPGKPVALSHRCYPDISLGELPRMYPYIMDSVGEGLLAKRRGKAVILSHLAPPSKVNGEANAVSEQLMELHRQLAHARTNGQGGREAVLLEELCEKMREAHLLDADTDTDEREEAIRMLPRRLERIRSRELPCGKHVLGKVPNEEQMRLYVEEAKRADVFSEEFMKERLGRTAEEMGSLTNGLSGGFVPTGQAGHLATGRERIFPTGRNFHSQDLRSMPTPAAWKVGVEMGEQLLEKYLTEEGAYPESIGVTLWSSDAFVAEGELTAQCLWLLGCKPCWRPDGRVDGLEVLTGDALTWRKCEGKPRPRIDVVVRMSGVVRDLLEPVYMLLDDAVEQVSSLDEAPEVNFVRKHVEERLEELKEKLPGEDELIVRRLATGRLFTDRDGSYGAGVGLAVDASAWKDDKDLANAYVNWTGGLCGRKMDGVIKKLGRRAVMGEFRKRMGRIDVAYQRAVTTQYDALSIGCYTGYQGGMASIKRSESGGEGPRMYWGDSQGGAGAEVRSLGEEIDLALGTRFMSPEWLREKMEEGYGGAAELSTMVNTLFSWSATARVVTKQHFDLVAKKLVEDEVVRKWFLETNEHAFEEVTRRLLEAEGRKLWEADAEQLDAVRAAALEVEGDIEDGMGSVGGEFQGSSVDILTEGDVSEWNWEDDQK